MRKARRFLLVLATVFVLPQANATAESLEVTALGVTVGVDPEGAAQPPQDLGGRTWVWTVGGGVVTAEDANGDGWIDSYTVTNWVTCREGSEIFGRPPFERVYKVTYYDMDGDGDEDVRIYRTTVTGRIRAVWADHDNNDAYGADEKAGLPP